MKRLMSAAMLALLAGAATAAAGPTDGARREMFQPAGQPAVAGVISWPPGPPRGPVSLVVILPDSLGPDWRADAYVARLNASGLAVLEVDLEAVVEAARPGESPPSLAAAVALIAAELAQDPRFSAQRIGVLGFGIGGRAALMVPPAPDGSKLVAARVALYPGCIGLEEAMSRSASGVATGASPILIMHGDGDAANSPPDCARAAAALSRRGPVERVEIAGAGYAWDRPAFTSEGPTLMPRPDGAGRIRAMPERRLSERSATQAAQWLASKLGREGEGARVAAPQPPATTAGAGR